jgi:sugar lactone lactonase YvrE
MLRIERALSPAEGFRATSRGIVRRCAGRELACPALAALSLILVVCGPVREASGVSGIIVTMAGGQDNTGDGGPATTAYLNYPFGVAVDGAGNVFFTDYAFNRIRKVTAATGIITTVAGNGVLGFEGDGGPATSARVNGPRGIAVDAAGNLFIADTNNSRVRKVAAGIGIITTVAGTGALGFSGDGGPATSALLNLPSGVAVDAAGNLLIADSSNSRLRMVAAGTGIITTVAGSVYGFGGDGGPAVNAFLSLPYGVAIDTAGNLFIADYGDNRVRMITAATGVITTVAGNGNAGFAGDGGSAVSAGLCSPTGVAIHPAGHVLIADFCSNRVRQVTAGTGIISTVALFHNPTGVAVDASGNLLIVEAALSRVRRVAADTGIVTLFAGNDNSDFAGDGGPATSARLSRMQGVAVDTAGNLFIADTQNLRVRKVAAGTGIITTRAGNGVAAFDGDGGPATGASLSDRATGLAVDSMGNLFIADTNNERIRRVDAGIGIITTYAGTGVAGFGGDGGPATSAKLFGPSSLAVDAADNLFIGDAGNKRIRRVDAATGIITTIIGNVFVDGLAVDAAGNVFIADAGLHRIQKLAAGNGSLTIIAGHSGVSGFAGDGGPATDALLACPAGLAVDAAGNLFIVDECNIRIRMIAAGSGIITTVAGSNNSGSGGDGGPATAAQLSDPTGVAVAATGDLFIADSGNNHRVRAVALHVTAPPPVIVSGPTNPTAATVASLAFASTEPGVVHFSCQLDTAGFSPCSSPRSYGSLASGGHSFQVTATDQFGDTSAPTTYTWTVTGLVALTVVRQGTGSGSVVSAPAGIACGATCSASYEAGTIVTLTATPEAGSVFTGWNGGGCGGSGVCVVGMTGATLVMANFSQIFTLTVAGAGTGAGTIASAPAGIACGATCAASYATGTMVTLTGTASAGSIFSGWDGGGCSGTGGCVITLTSATTVTATFSAAPLPLTVTVAGAGAGLVTSLPGGIACGATCAASYSLGAMVTLTATPDPGSAFVSWSGGGCGSARTCVVSLATPTAVTATFGVAGPFTFGDPNITGGLSIIKAVHVTEARAAINAARLQRGMAAFSFSDADLAAGHMVVKATHISELRTALGEIYSMLGAAAPSYTDPVIGVGTTPVRAAHIRELRYQVETLP